MDTEPLAPVAGKISCKIVPPLHLARAPCHRAGNFVNGFAQFAAARTTVRPTFFRERQPEEFQGVRITG